MDMGLIINYLSDESDQLDLIDIFRHDFCSNLKSQVFQNFREHLFNQLQFRFNDNGYTSQANK